MEAIFTILGCGSSGGVPRADGQYWACDPNHPRNQRSRCSAAVMVNDGVILIDTSPDLRYQTASNGIGRVDAVLYTHDHADQCHGIDDIRVFFLKQQFKPIPAFADPQTYQNLQQRFGYCFDHSNPFYPAIMALHSVETPFEVTISNQSIKIIPIPIRHGKLRIYGYRIGGVAYLPDVSEIPQTSMAKLMGLEVLIIDALRYRYHTSHANLAQTLKWIQDLAPKQAVITNMHIDMDYATLHYTLAAYPSQTPIVPAYDGMQLAFNS